MFGSSPRLARLVGAAALLGAALALQPVAPATLHADADCTSEYDECITEASTMRSVIREMAYVECFAEWTGCVVRKL